MPDEEAYIFKVRNLYGRHVRICGGHKREGGCALPREDSLLVISKITTATAMSSEKFGEISRGIVVGPTTRLKAEPVDSTPFRFSDHFKQMPHKRACSL